MVSTPLKHINQNGKLPQIGAKRTNIWNHNLVLFLGNHFGFIQGGPHHPIFVSGVIRGLLGGPHLVGEKMPVYHPQRNVIDVFKGWTGPGPTWTIGFWRKINFEQRNKTVDYLFLLEESPWTRILSWGLLYIFKQASACQPPTREICCIGPGIVDSWEKELYIMLDIMYIYIYLHISKYFFVFFWRLTWKPRDVDILCPYTHGRRRAKSTQISPEIGPQFPEHGAGNRAPISGKTPPPEIGAQFGPLVAGIEPATFWLQACAPPTRPNSSGQHGHTSSFATWPSPPAPARPNPKSKIQTPNGPFGFWILDFGFRILDFGFWILDFGFWILDFGFWILDFGFRILDFGFWILDFGFWILDFGSV